MAVRIISRGALDDLSPEQDYLHVYTWTSPDDAAVTLATIQRYIDSGEEVDEGGTTWRIRTLLANHPMSLDEAMGFARRYAERKNIPLVVTDAGEEALKAALPDCPIRQSGLRQEGRIPRVDARQKPGLRRSP